MQFGSLRFPTISDQIWRLVMHTKACRNVRDPKVIETEKRLVQFGASKEYQVWLIHEKIMQLVSKTKPLEEV